ncbi:MAG: Rieske 2Fe-2S domain-containing protein [Ilumatobacteraceae bacterium]
MTIEDVHMPAVATPSPERTVRAVVAKESEIALGSMKMSRVGGRRVVVVRTSTGFHALDNACPHEGYGLVQGALDGEMLTCEWHNWKFRVSDGACLMGEEAVTRHDVTVVDGEVVVSVVEPPAPVVRAKAIESLNRGIDGQHNGQIARDSLRLLHAGADPVAVIWQGVARTAPRTEYGWNHALAMATDCITAATEMDGDDRLIPVAQAIAGVAESELRRPARERPRPRMLGDGSGDPSHFDEYRSLVETEQADAADSLLTGALHGGLSRGDAARWLIQSSCDHHLSFGHGAIYTQKAFEMLDAVGWEHAADLLAHVALMHVTSTREDRLPYMRPFLGALEAGDLARRWRRATDPAWSGRDALTIVLLGTDQVAAVAAATRALDEGAGVNGLLDAVSVAASERMLRHDLDNEQHPDVSGYGWLDVTHSLTYAHAARWAWQTAPSADTARLAMYTVFHVVDAGRHAASDSARTGGTGMRASGSGGAATGPSASQPPVRPTMLLADALARGQPDAAVAAAIAEPPADVADALVRASLDDRSGALIVVAHHIKTARAAIRESAATGSRAPLAAAARFIAAPAKQRFVAQDVARARHFLTTGTPPPR